MFGKCHSLNILPFYKLKVIEMKTLKIILIHLFFETESSAQSHKTLENNPLSVLSFFYFYTGFALFCCFWGGHSTGIHSGNAILLKFIKNYLCVQLAGWSPCSTAAFSAGKPNASHPIGFITCQEKGKTQAYIIFWNGINNTHRPLNNNRCFASK